MARPRNTVTCRDCGAEFNLEAQWYYDNLCPSCKAEQDGEETTQPACCVCDDRFDPDDGLTATVINPNTRSGTERVGVCSEDCKQKAENARP